MHPPLSPMLGQKRLTSPTPDEGSRQPPCPPFTDRSPDSHNLHAQNQFNFLSFLLSSKLLAS